MSSVYKIPLLKNPAIAILKSICKKYLQGTKSLRFKCLFVQIPFAQNPYNFKIPSLKISVGYKIPSLKMPFCTKLLCSNPLQYQNPFALNFCRVQNPFFRNPFSKILPVWNPFFRNPFSQNPFTQTPFAWNPFSWYPFTWNPFWQKKSILEKEIPSRKIPSREKSLHGPVM